MTDTIRTSPPERHQAARCCSQGTVVLILLAILAFFPRTTRPQTATTPGDQAGETARAQTAAQPETPDRSPSYLYPESEISGSVEVGYQWTAGFRGNMDVYRSTVNLGRGPKLFNFNFDLSGPQGANRFVDRFSLNASNWGGDPYNTARVFAEKYGLYRLTFDYRNMKYYNFIPTFANPALERGSLLGQHSFDITRRMVDFELVFMPNSWISPFVGYYGSSGSGPGITTYTGEQNEYAVRTQLDDATRTYRMGLSLTTTNATLVLEQRWMNARNDMHVFQTLGPNFGNRQGPVLGRITRLDALDENYHSRGNTPTTIAQFSLFPLKELTVSGRFVYSKPDTDFAYDRLLAGQFVSFTLLRAFTGERASGLSDAERPHTTLDLAVEFNPTSSLRILESLYMNRFHVASSSSLTRVLTGSTNLAGLPDTGGQFDAMEQSSNRFAYNTNQNQVDAVVTLSPRISFRGGHRYLWSDVDLIDRDADAAKSGDIHRNVVLAGLRFNLPQRTSAFLDMEIGRSSAAFNRTNLLDYTKVRARGRYQVREGLTLTSSVTFTDNKNPKPEVDYNFRSWGYNIAVAYAPVAGGRISMGLDYSRADLSSDVLFIIPQLLETDRSVYIEDSHFGGLNMDVRLMGGSRLLIGYGVVSTTGTHPIVYHQPVASLDIPVSRRVNWINQWRYFDLNDKISNYDKFHINLVMSSLRFNF